MDNITHSLIGYTLGRTVSKKESPDANSILWTAILGNNIPDFDLLFKPFVVSGNLGYLLHHRGYSHTFFAALFLGVASASLGNRLGGKSWKPTLKLCLIGWLSVLLHIGADFCNNYGVHPGSPFWNSWLYGDFIFIVEPLIWICTLPLVYFTAQSKFGKRISLILGLILTLLVWSLRFNSWSVALGLSIVAILFTAIQSKFRNSLPAVLGIASVLVLFKWNSSSVKKDITQHLQQVNPQFISQQLVATPAPGNPFCWSVISLLTHESDQQYLIRKGNYSFFPQIFPPESCTLKTGSSGSVGYQKPSITNTDQIQWEGEIQKSLKEFTLLENNNCAFRSFLKFARIPVWFESNGSLGAIDLRYDQKERQFTWVDLSGSQECPMIPPPWTYPTEAILESAKRLHSN